MSFLLVISKILIATIMIGAGIFYLDIRSLVLEFKRIRIGHGSSGVPFVAIPIYALGVWLLPQYILGLHKGYLFVGLLVLHACCHFAFPYFYRWTSKQ